MRLKARWVVSGCVGLALLAPPALVLGAPQAGATFTYARTGETETLDPEKTTAVASAEADFLIYDTLVSLDTDYTYKPSLPSFLHMKAQIPIKARCVMYAEGN